MRGQCLYSRTPFESLAPMTVTTTSQSLSLGLIMSLGSQEPNVPFWGLYCCVLMKGLRSQRWRTLKGDGNSKTSQMLLHLPPCQRFPPGELLFALLFQEYYICWAYRRTDSFPVPPPLDMSYFFLLGLLQKCPNSYPCF